MDRDARRAAETAARTSYGRLLALLSAQSRDIAACEDALAEAFVSALRDWPEKGVPANPEAWLLTAARNSIKNVHRHRNVADAAQAEIERRIECGLEKSEFPDERLKLLFVCAHPAIDAAARTPLMLQTVLGLDAARIANAFLVAPSTMGQRLVRAKAKIRDGGLRFSIPDREEMPERLDDVLNAIYAAYGTGWDAIAGADNGVRGLREEAIYLGRLVISLMPAEPEPKGLLALMLYCEARQPARRGSQGEFVPLSQQDANLWSRDMIIEAEGLLTLASAHGRFGRFQCEAAIQSVHVQRPVTGRASHDALLILYDLLMAHSPSLGVLVGRSAALLDAGDSAGALRGLDDIAEEQVASYQPYWVTRAHTLRALGREAEALAALNRALGLTEDDAVRDYLRITAS